MAGIDNLRKRLTPLMAASSRKSIDPTEMSIDATASYKVSDRGTLNLRFSCAEYHINQKGLQVNIGPREEEEGTKERTYRCASSEMCVFSAIGWGASSVVRKAIHIPTHRILALKKINVFEKEKRQQLLNEIRTLCEAPRAKGLVEFYGAFYSPDSGQISIALEYMDGGSLADVVRAKGFIPEPMLSVITKKVLQGLHFLHSVRHLVHRDIKPANLLLNLEGEPKITDFGISAGLDNSIAMCATFVGTVTYMSPERINNQNYSFPVDIWSLGLTLLECGTGEFPYNASKGPVNLMLQVIEDPSPSPPADAFSPEFRSFVDACLQKDPNLRPTADQLLTHPFILKYDYAQNDLAAFIQDVFPPTERLKDLSDMLAVHYFSLFDGPDELWIHMKGFYRSTSTLAFSGEVHSGQATIYETLSKLRNMLSGKSRGEKLVHIIDNLECCGSGRRGVMIRVFGGLVLGTRFIPPGETCPIPEDSPLGGFLSTEDLNGKRMGTFSELFVIEGGEQMGSFWISKHEIHIHTQPPS